MLFFFSTRFASAEDAYPLITYQCDTTTDAILMGNTLLTAEQHKHYPYSDADGSYSPWHMVDIDRSKKYVHISATRKIVKTCILSSGEYTVTIEPQIFSRDLTGRCGEAISAAVTIAHDGIDVQERLPFEDYCLGNAPVITKLKFSAKTGRTKLKRVPKFEFH